MAHTFVTGGIGSGKTYLAARLGELTGLGVVGLDCLFFNLESSTHRDKKDEQTRNQELASQFRPLPQIFEGWHFGDWLIPLYQRLSVVVVVDTPLELRRQRIRERYERRKSGAEPDPFPNADADHLANLLEWTRKFDAQSAEEELRHFTPLGCEFYRTDGSCDRATEIAEHVIKAGGRSSERGQEP